MGIVRNGERLLYINGLARELMTPAYVDFYDDTWRHKSVGICDGGIDAFGAVFSLSGDRFQWFSFNDLPGERYEMDTQP